MENEIIRLKNIARMLRKDVVSMIHESGDGHPAPALSSADIITALYFNVMNIDPSNPKWEDRDRFILSKGHACPILYAALAHKGYFSLTELPRLRRLGSILQGHPDMKKTPGIDMTSGSLGNGISIGVGMTLAGRIKKKDYYTYVITGDGELQEGVIWEALMTAKKYKLSKLIVIIDSNGMQSGGSVPKVSGLYPLYQKLEAFGWHCQEIDGHNMGQILNAIEKAKIEEELPSMILAHTVKGKGVPYMEGDNSWHKRIITAEEMKTALVALGGDETC